MSDVYLFTFHNCLGKANILTVSLFVVVELLCSAQCLFSGFQTVRVGVVGTPVGTVTLSCAYRTNLAFMSNRYQKWSRFLFSENKETCFHSPLDSVSNFLNHADNLSVQLPSWGLLWIILWTPLVAANVQSTLGSPAITSSYGNAHSLTTSSTQT